MTVTLSPLQPPNVFEIKEKTTAQYTAVVTDDLGNPLPAASLATLTLTLYVIKTDGTTGIVNSRNAQNVLNANNVTVNGNGAITWQLQVGDTTLVEVLPFERHIALFTWTWTSGTGRHEVIFNVQNLVLVS